ncbi:glycerate kinase [Streptomyces sp. NPDC050161]|uniref:glycerate kinase n=1 Tax=Streptomyces sp. NPDC050161 TaxID=3365604 RepID=UPI0037A5CBA5
MSAPPETGTVLVAPDSFKGTFTASDAARHLAAGVRDAGLRAVACPLADGGEGTLDVLLTALGGTRLPVSVHGPWGDPLIAYVGLLPDGTAVVESAQAAGLTLPTRRERDPETASTRGVGELINAASARGAGRVLVTVGGVATTDGGRGALEAIEDAGRGHTPQVTVLCDVRTRFADAAVRYGPQKGAGPEEVARLTAQLGLFAARLPKDPRGVPGTGAAGGLAGGLWAALDADLVSGADHVLDAVGFDGRLRRATAVVVGEGRLDAQTAEGKIIDAVIRRAARNGVPVHAVVGSTEPGLATVPGIADITLAGDADSLRRAGTAIARGYRG